MVALSLLQSTHSTTEHFDSDPNAHSESIACSVCIATATATYVVNSAAHAASQACQQAAWCAFATCVTVLNGCSTSQSSSQEENIPASPASTISFKRLYAPPVPLTMAERGYPLLDVFESGKRSAPIKRLAIIVWTGGYILRPAPTMQVCQSTDLTVSQICLALGTCNLLGTWQSA